MADQEYGTQSDIRVAPELSFSLAGTIDATGVTANRRGRKIIKAGTPVVADGWLEDGTQVLHAVGSTPDNTSTGPKVDSVTTTDTTATVTLE
ncbi:hypothetical protein [Secundilactobacillus yichangensis]|uniref:hypothetical protein n=1 Tax=Secundilactobacillus yichangensis TaxID=2799580 RepID=UPI0019425A6B|nr:hypothetical protein [Secundilactobacillus yichangensis]